MKIGKMSIIEFVDGGYLQEVNRQFFHPLGLALEVFIPSNREADYVISGVRDYRNDATEAVFPIGDLAGRKVKARKITEEQDKRHKERQESLGYIIEPL